MLNPSEQPMTMVEAVKAYEADLRAINLDDENWTRPRELVERAPIRSLEDVAAFIEYLKEQALADAPTTRADIRTFHDIDSNGYDWEGCAMLQLAREAANFLPVTAEDLGIRLDAVAEKMRAEAIQDQAEYRARLKREEAERLETIAAMTTIQQQAMRTAREWPRGNLSYSTKGFSDFAFVHSSLFVGEECRPDDVGRDVFRGKVEERAAAIEAAFPDLQTRGLVEGEKDGFTVTEEGYWIAELIKETSRK